MRGTFEEPPTGLIPWFSKTEGNTYATIDASPFPLQGKPKQAQDVARRISGAVAGDGLRSSQDIPSTHHKLLSSALRYLPFAPRFPLPHFTLAILFSLSFPIFSSLLLLAFFCLLVCLFVLMASPKGPGHLLRRMEEIESNIRSFMNLQFEPTTN